MLIAGRYQVLAELGRGGMGTVYQGEDTQSGKPIAIKRLQREISNDAVIERFRREGEALRQLNHPNIVVMLDAVEEQGEHYLIMEYVPGGDLNELLMDGPLPVSQILRLSIDIADALTRAHRLNIIHRDLKPGNVLIAADGTPRLTDFGVAHLAEKERVTETSAIIGTLDYLAPEALNGGAIIDPRADIWAFGVMLFEMLSGKRPFSSDSIAGTLYRIANEPAPDLQAMRPDLPEALVDLVYRMLEKDPQARMSSVRHVGAVLEDIIQGRKTGVDTVIVPRQARFDTPASDRLRRPMHNLPAQTTPFVGREAELAELERLLRDPQVRLVTIVAQGGMGKTRLSLEAGERHLSDFNDGVYFVELAPLSDPDNIASVVAEAAGYPMQSDSRDERQQILDYLSAKNLLLIMDNFEHLIDGAGLVTDILAAAPGVSILATSRQRLNQVGETVFNLQGMDFPHWESPDDALEYAAVKLFIQSARRVQPGFEVAESNMDYIARICKQVHGLPLGILLAASWLSILSPEEITGEIARSIDFLESDMGGLPERHRSIRAVFEYSWDLMSADEKQVFMKLALFRGGFTREAAQTVAGGNLRTMMNLLNKSLIQRNVDSGRYDIHELLRQFGEQKLVESGDLEQAMRAYMDFFAALVPEQCENIKGQSQLAGLNTMELELENVQNAWYAAVNAGHADVVGQMLEGVYLFCLFRSRLAEGSRMFAEARRQWPATPQADLLAGRLHVRFPEAGADPEDLFRLGLEIAQRSDDRHETAFCLQQLGRHLSHQKFNPAGLTSLEEGLAIFRELGGSFYVAWVLDDLGWGYGLAGKSTERVSVIAESLEIRRAIGDRIGTANSLRNHASMIWVSQGPWMTSSHLKEAAGISRELGDRTSLAWSELILSFVMMVRAEFEEGRQLLIDGSDIAFDIQVPVLMALARIIQGFQKALAGENQAALDLVAAGVAYDNPDNPDAALLSFISGATVLAYAGMGRHDKWLDSFVEMVNVYSAMLQDSHIFFCNYFPAYSLKLAAEGRDEDAVVVMHTALEINRWSEHWVPLRETRQRLRENLGEDVFNAAVERGKAQDPEQEAREFIKAIVGKVP